MKVTEVVSRAASGVRTFRPGASTVPGEDRCFGVYCCLLVDVAEVLQGACRGTSRPIRPEREAVEAASPHEKDRVAEHVAHRSKLTRKVKPFTQGARVGVAAAITEDGKIQRYQ